MNRLPVVMKMYARDKWSWFYLPWVILLSSFAVNLAISLFVQDAVYTGGLCSIFIYMLVVGILSLAQMFPFALNLGLRRTDFFLGTAVMILAVSAASSLLLFLLSLVETQWSGWGTDLHFFHLPYVNDGTGIEQIWIYFIVMLHAFSLGFVICSVLRRFGGAGFLTLFIGLTAAMTIVGFIISQHRWWDDIFGWIGAQSAFGLSLWLAPAVVIYGLLSYGMLRKAAV